MRLKYKGAATEKQNSANCLKSDSLAAPGLAAAGGGAPIDSHQGGCARGKINRKTSLYLV